MTRVPRFRTVTGAERWARKQFGFKWDLSGCRLIAAVQSVEQFSILADDFPTIAASMLYVGTSEKLLHTHDEVVFGSGALAAYSQSEIHLNPAYYSDSKPLSKDLVDCFNGWSPWLFASPASVMSHEFGHAVHQSVKMYPDFLEWACQNTCSPDSYSEYAKTSYSELFAEAFSDFYHSDEPTKYAVELVKLLKVIVNRPFRYDHPQSSVSSSPDGSIAECSEEVELPEDHKAALTGEGS